MLLLYLAQLFVVRHAARILDSQADALAETNRELDQRVAERTHALSASNAQLQDEIQERCKAEEQLERLARHDPLTGLPNRLMFSELLSTLLADSRLNGDNLTLLFIDLDHFKDVNDTLGHFIGDQLLKAVVTALSAGVRPGDTLTRFGGDEFVCILRDADDATITACANKLLGCFDEPFIIGGNRLHLSASIGICRAPQDGKDVETLVRNADIAMYRAKAAGRNRYEYYTQAMSAAVEERRWLEEHLRRAIENESLTVHFQAKIESGSGRLGGAEALARWNDAALGPVSPGRFIPIAEETGLIVALGALVLEKTCQQIRAWLDAGYAAPCVSVNVSVKQLEQDQFPERIATLLHQYDLPPSSLELEITESVIMAADDAIGMLERIHNLGVKLAIDDFGTGYSSLTYLKQLPVEVLKIDRAFIVGIGQSSHDEAIIRTIITLADNLGLATVAEGVEEENQVTFLTAAGCNLIQGYYYSHPQAAAEFSQRWLSAA
jgi:diguanylate cyclase (GGDEF)-like protein